ncbi:alpha-L-iduronidase-like [Pollicipes pollicipes]|uniref:alpha-L-iduronidase-like n=1 Tax=Pollicipes pollicipes TaxID=41117 RepID=UPI00188524AD|nr:alpha-L-iduronidase-like [Pollicipes pollicipes]
MAGSTEYRTKAFTWKRCIRTYEVQFRTGGNLTFQRINEEDTIFNLFQWFPGMSDGKASVRGSYRVRAVDYAGTPGPFSSVVVY